jgi:glutathione S-transferase
MLGLFERTLLKKGAGGPFLLGEFGGVDAMYAPAVVRLAAFEVPTDGTPRAADYLRAVLEHPEVSRWMGEARSLPPRETY